MKQNLRILSPQGHSHKERKIHIDFHQIFWDSVLFGEVGKEGGFLGGIFIMAQEESGWWEKRKVGN
jgi:hypothetical protein